MGREGGFFDRKLLFSNSQEVTASAASTYEINTGVADANLGAGTPIGVFFIIDETFTGGTSMTFELQHSADGSSYATIAQLPAIAEASLVAGEKIGPLALPDEHYQYLQIYYTVVGSHGAGAITSYLQPIM